MKDLISIIVPIFKVEKYLSQCVTSIVNQTYQNLEILLVDDGSPDNCGKICDNFAKEDPRIKVIHKANGGLSDARNVAIDVAQGEWIIFIDSDDFVEPNHVEILFNLTQKYRCLIACSDYKNVYENETLKKENLVQNEDTVWPKWTALQYLFCQKHISTSAWGKIYHKSLFASGIRYPFGLIYEDMPTTYLLFLQCDCIAFCKKKTYNYLIRSTSLEGCSFSEKKAISAVQIIKSIQSHESELSQISSSVISRLFSFSMHILLSMPTNYESPEKDFLTNYIKRNRKTVIFSKAIRPKARIAAIISLLGTRVSKKILNIISIRK